MSVLRARLGLQGLGRHGVTLADQPGLILKGKEPVFFSMSRRPPLVEDPLGALRAQFAVAIEYARRDTEFDDLHLYYLDADGRAILSLPVKPQVSPSLKFGDKFFPLTPVSTLKLVRRYEAYGKTGLRFRTKEEIRDVYTTLEKFQTSYQLGWGGQFFARDPDARTSIFRHFDPVRSGLLRVEEKLTNLSFSLQLFQESEAELIGYRVVTTTLDEVTLEEALAWS